MPTAPGRGRCDPGVALLALAALAAAQSAWNALTLPPLLGYDAPGHAGYVLTLVREGRLPHPLEGWSTFHPPLYYAVAAALWSLLEPLGPAALTAALRAPGALAWLAAGVVAWRSARHLGAAPRVALAAAALVWFVPSNQFAAVMIGNEALAAALAGFAVPFLLRLQDDPGDRPAAVGAGLLAGLALAAKYSGFWVAAGAVVPWLRRGIGRRELAAAAAGAAVAAVVAGPVYLRNLVLTGTPVPMTRDLEPMRGAEAAFELRPRRACDYLTLDRDCFLRPSLYHVPGRPGSYANLNPAMTHVFGLVYAGFWYDAFGHRVPIALHRDGFALGPALLALGFVPTLLLLAGLVAATVSTLRRGSAEPLAPLVAMAWLALGSFVAFTWRAPSLAAAKASYFLPLAVPAALLFCRGAALLAPRVRTAAAAVSLLAALAAGAAFTHRVLVSPDPALGRILVATWTHIDRQLPGAHIGEAVRLLYGLEAAGAAERSAEPGGAGGATGGGGRPGRPRPGAGARASSSSTSRR